MENIYGTLKGNQIYLDDLTFKLLYQIGDVSVKKYNNFLKRYSNSKIKVFKKNPITVQQAQALKHLAASNGYNFIFEEPEYTLESFDNTLDHITLRDYQEEAVRLALTRHAGIFKLGVNAGKTEILASICKNFSGRVLIVINSKTLLHETSQRVEEYLREPVGLCGDSKLKLDPRVVVGIPQSLCKHKLDFDMVLCDEMDTLTHKAATKVFNKLKDARMFGLSGSPFKKKDKEHEIKARKLFGSVLIDVGSKELTDRGISAKGDIIFHKLPHPKKPEDPADDLVENVRQYKDFIVNNKYRNATICTLALKAVAESKVVYISTNHETHMHIIYNMLRRAIPAKYVKTLCGSDSSKVREDVLDKVRNREVRVIIATSVIGRGVSINSLDVLINAAGGQSSLQVVQRLGRILRNRDGKHFQYHDFIDCGCNSHKKHSRNRYKEIKDELETVIRIV